MDALFYWFSRKARESLIIDGVGTSTRNRRLFKWIEKGRRRVNGDSFGYALFRFLYNTTTIFFICR